MRRSGVPVLLDNSTVHITKGRLGPKIDYRMTVALSPIAKGPDWVLK
jgi:hypothetical protein